MIKLAWPPRELHPNNSTHWGSKKTHIKKYREYARIITLESGAKIEGGGKIHLQINFYPPDKRRRDLDGMLSNVKSGLDGIADGLGVDDYRFALSIDRMQSIRGGGVEIIIVRVEE
jgi:crossover junction endodeoxyribonuclease RusA